jgi:hypothetical protein
MNNKIELEDRKKEGRIREIKRKREMYRRSLPGNVVIDHPFEGLKILKFETAAKTKITQSTKRHKMYNIF